MLTSRCSRRQISARPDGVSLQRHTACTTTQSRQHRPKPHTHGWRSWNCACGQHVCVPSNLPTNPPRCTCVPWPQPPRPLAQPDASQRPPLPWPVPPPPPPYVALRPPGPLAAAELEKPHTKHSATSSQGLRRRRNRKDVQKIAVCVNLNQPTLPPLSISFPFPTLCCT